MRMSYPRAWLLVMLVLLAAPAHASEPLRIAAAASLRHALGDIVSLYQQTYPEARIEVVYGSSGKMTTQIINGAPYDLFFSADMAFPEQLRDAGLTANEPAIYALGRIVIWSTTLDASQLSLDDLKADSIRRIAIAQPAHAPYGQLAQQAMTSAGVWGAVQHKLVYGENISHAAQMTQSGAAQVGIIALSLAVYPELAEHPHALIDASLHGTLHQGYVVTRRGGNNPQALAFADFMSSATAQEILSTHGFALPD